MTDLHIACRRRDVGGVRKFIKIHPELIDEKDENSLTGLMITLMRKHHNSQNTYLLLMAGANPKLTNSKGKTVFEQTYYAEQVSMIKDFLEGKSICGAIYHWDFIFSGDIEGFNKLYEKDRTVVNQSLNSVPNLLIAASAGDLNFVKYLIERGANIDSRVDDKTLLSSAVESCNPILVQWVLDNYPKFKFDKDDLRLTQNNLDRETWPYNHNMEDCDPRKVLHIILKNFSI